jgi:hypothetical protein
VKGQAEEGKSKRAKGKSKQETGFRRTFAFCPLPFYFYVDWR